MHYKFDSLLNEGRWLTDDGRIAAFAFDNTICHLIEPKKRDIRWQVLDEPTCDQHGLLNRPTSARGRATSFEEAKHAMARRLPGCRP